MESIFYFVLIIIAAVMGGVIGHKLKLPAGGMLGAMAAVISFNLIVQPPISMPGESQVALQLAFGPVIGSRITKGDMLGLKSLALPAVAMLICMLGMNIFFGTVMYRFSTLDLATALFATAPGGMLDMAIVSADFGANSAYVALLQLSRLMFIFICMIPFYKKAMTKLAGPLHMNQAQTRESLVSEPAATPGSLVPDGLPPEPSSRKRKAKYFFITALCACCLGIALRMLNVPGGAIMGAMVGSAAYNILSGKAYFPTGLRLPLQILAGIFIGMRLDRESLFAMNEIIIPVIILFAGVVVMTLVTSFVMHKLTRLDSFTSLLASTPGGLSEMAMLADDLGVDAPKVAVLHMARLMSVIIFFPAMLAVVLRFLL